MRLPYAPKEPAPSAPSSVSDVYAAVAARRGARGLQALDLTLLHSPAYAMGWNGFLGAVRTQTQLSTTVRELAICRVAVLNGAEYEWAHHAPLLLDAVSGSGSSAEADAKDTDKGKASQLLRVVLEREAFSRQQIEAGRPGDEALTEEEWAVLDYADQMTRNVKVDDAVFARVRQHFSEQQTVELTGTIAAYNCVSRFLVALDVAERNGERLVLPSAGGGHS